MSGLKEFARTTARPLPVIILADTSGSMSVENKIGVMNSALNEMFDAFSQEKRLRAEIQVCLITFGGEHAEETLPLTAAHKIESLLSLNATGRTPMGGAFELAFELLEDKELIPSRAYRPVVILVSDGHPNDYGWKESFDKLCSSERAKKATRLAMAIGNDADEEMLQKFTNDLEAPLFKAQDVRDIQNFFRAVTMSVSNHSINSNPNAALNFSVPEISEDELDLDF